MNIELLKNNVLKTLLYYDMFSFPLRDDELFTFMPANSIKQNEFSRLVREISAEESNPFAERDGYFYVKPNDHYIISRKEKEEPTKKMWRIAGLVTHLVKRFPFVRCIIVSGSLSKNNSDRKSDLDLMIITEKDRMWIARSLLMVFKKIFLFNSYKYFCINYYVTTDYLEIEDKNIFTATEVAYVKATYNTDMMHEFIRANSWITEFFPNYIFGDPRLHAPGCKVNNRPSYLQKFFELLFIPSLAVKLDRYLMGKTKLHWLKKYGNIDPKDRDMMFRSTETVSKTHPHNMQKLVLTRYNDKLKEFDL